MSKDNMLAIEERKQKALEIVHTQKLRECFVEHPGFFGDKTVYINENTGIWACYYCLRSGPFVDGFCMKQLPTKEDVLIGSVDNLREEMYRLLNKLF